MISRYTQRGFSFITLIFLIALVVFGYIAFQQFKPFAASADAKRKEDLSKIQAALGQYYEQYNKYPSVNRDHLMVHGYPVEWGAVWKPFLDPVPKDADLTLKKRYVYFATEDGQAYWLYASLDNKEDPGACNSGNACFSIADNKIQETACGGICNYGVSSSNTSP
ncbi:MAG: hypothetical protein HYT11_00230 [Candidatus Levybacteria bacterium]|nr:hypothetical protein [Candidatus Levybacteria bacterium]